MKVVQFAISILMVLLGYALSATYAADAKAPHSFFWAVFGGVNLMAAGLIGVLLFAERKRS